MSNHNLLTPPFDIMQNEEKQRKAEAKKMERISVFFDDTKEGKEKFRSFVEFSRSRHRDRMNYDVEPFGEDAEKFNKTDEHEAWVQQQILRDRDTPPIFIKPKGMSRGVGATLRDVILQNADSAGPGGVEHDGFKEVL
jgi:hypothetical protein